MIKRKLKALYLRLLFLLPHDNIYAFHNLSSHPALELTGRKLDTQAFYDFVRRHGPYVSLTDILASGNLSSKAAITFDDGLEDVYSIAYPFLTGQGIPFTAFILTDKLDQPGYLTTAQVVEMAQNPLVTIGSHGTDHTRLSAASPEKQRHELHASREKLQALLGRPCTLFAYPFGAYNQTTLALMKESGYRLACAVKGRPLLRGNHDDPYTIPRLSIDDTTLDLYDY
ncbi:MAG: polysaccharide deacetylase family protein [Clostridia bacterium]|nr:polysaccharide deacetylase family protein [Clostridia bacterium]